MPVEPVPCGDGGGSTPVDVTTCCSPSIASAPLCRADGSTVLLVVRSGCVECGDAADSPAVAGWIDAATGVFTAGAAPADSGPCESGCVDTVCRQLCDDADGDGEADTTYSELWCIRADGSAELVLTYRDDPSVPYMPVAPVDCAYGCPETETVTLCDENGPFLRRYTWLQGVATFEDFALDGISAHVVTGTVGVCDTSEPCEAQSTPAATLGLCLADGTPIAVVVTRDCTGAVAQDGWVNLTTGTYTAGGPPVGAMACGNPRSISTTGTFCDVDPVTGDVHGLVLIEYTYDTDGAVASVHLIDATTGQPYTVEGEVTTCPAGVAQPERDIVQLCDTTAGGAVIEFVRDFARDENGQITGHSDYRLDGTPYAPTGTVGRCSGDCRDCEQVIVCDVPADTTAAKITHVAATGSGASGTLPNGVGWTVPGGSQLADFWPVGLYPAPTAGPLNVTFARPVSVAWDAKVGRSGTNVGALVMPAGTVLVSLAAGHLWDAATRTLTAGPTAGTVTATSPASAFRHDGPVTALAFSSAGGTPLALGQRQVGNFVVTPATQPFVRTTCRGCNGAVTTVTNTLLDGTTTYTPSGTVRVCQPPPAPEGRDVEVTPMCVVDNATGGILQRIIAEVTYDTTTGDRLSVAYVDPLTWGPVAVPGGAHLDVCPDGQPDPVPDVEVVQLCDLVDGEQPVPFLRHLAYLPGATAPTVVDTALDGATPYALTGTAGACSTSCGVQAVLEECRCDDVDGDGVGEVGYVELVGIDCDGRLTSLGTYTSGLTAPYTPVAPVDCDAPGEEAGADPAFGVQARRTELTAGASWSAASWPTLQSVTAVAHGGTGTITTEGGTSTLYAAESATWSVGRDVDAALRGPLTITADTGTVTVTYTTGVQL
ncbi:hypothetical protein [Streptomyces californicus]|uniref:hypothetical protein n=1 Tax=Streptomyces californicus TaxID=67351 RepID=UPI00380D1D31